MRNYLWRHPGHLFWILLAYLPWLGGMSVPLTGDQKVYLSTALEMRQQGSWLKPLLFGEASYYKPPFQYWATLVSWKIFGFNLFATLLPSVLCVVLIAWLLGEIALLLGERRWFVNAGLWFAAALGTMTYGTTAQMEIYLCFFYAASWWAGLKFLSRRNDRNEIRNWAWIFLAFGLAGLSALVKSPLYSVFWVLSFVSYLLVSGEWLLFRQRNLYLALLSGMGIGLAWYLTILKVDGAHFWADYAMRETWEKKGGNQGTLGSIWGALFYFCIPFTLLILPSLRAILRGRRTGGLMRFILCWSWPAALFFSFYPYRIKPYLFLLVPALAVLVDWGYFRVGRTLMFRLVMGFTGLVMFIALSGLALILQRAELVPIWIISGLVVTGVITLICASKNWMRGFVLCALAAVFFIRVGAVQIGEADLKPLRDAVAGHPAAAVGMLDQDNGIWHEIGLLSVAIEKPMVRLHTVDEVSKFIADGGIVALNDEQAGDFDETIGNQVEVLKPGQTLKFQAWPRLKGRTKFPYRMLIEKGKRGVPDFDQLIHREFKILSL